jgi:prepilin-type N-terminal cleavage/methylation domain-containing protein
MRKGGEPRGFTLIELMVVFTTIGVLSAIALPRINLMLKRARMVEAVTTVAALERSLTEYFNRNDRYPLVAGVQNPPGTSWGAKEMNMAAAGWDQLGYKPEGSYRFRYEFESSENGRKAQIRARGDTDGDGEEALLIRFLENGYKGDTDTVIDE